MFSFWFWLIVVLFGWLIIAMIVEDRRDQRAQREWREQRRSQPPPLPWECE